MKRFGRLFITGQERRNTSCQMQITTMCGCKQWMPLVIMQQHERTTAQDFARVPDESSGNQGVGVDRFAMAIHVYMRRWSSLAPCFHLPESARPPRQCCSEGFISIGGRQSPEKAFDVTITVGLRPSRQQPQFASRVGA